MKRRTFFLSLTGLAGCTPRAQRLNVFNWSNYIADDTLARFHNETGIAVRYGIYESNEEMLARVMSGNSGWDVVFPTNYFVTPMREMGLLAPIQRDQISQAGNLFSQFAAPQWDPQLNWCVPYMWGSSGILYNAKVTPAPKRWSDMWDPRLGGRITMLDDPAEVLGATLKKIGLPLNSSGEAELLRAKQEALRQKPLLRAYLNAEVRDQVVAGDVLVAQLWATTAQQAIDDAPHLHFAYPEEGFPLYADCAAILKESQHADLAHRFIDFLLRPDIGESIVAFSRTATTNEAAHRRLRPEVASLETLYPNRQILARGEWFATVPAPAQRLRDRIWTEIKSA